MAGIFKAYDIRGIYPDELDEALARDIGVAAGNLLEDGTVVVGHDMREVAVPIAESLVDGLRAAGQAVLDIGLCSTPMNYSAIGHHDAAGGVMVTASHNPPEYIGFKLSRREARPVSYESGIKTIESACTEGRLPEADHRGGSAQRSFLATYVERSLGYVRGIDDLTIAVDTGNGMGGLTVPEVFERLPIDLTVLYGELDGTFPNHVPNPLETKNMVDLQEEVRSGDYDLGMAFDGDADRVAFVDENGDIVASDLLTALLVEPNLRGNPGAPIVYDLRSSRVVPEEIERHGGKPVRHRVGHAYMKEKMREVEAPFGGELSGHYYYRKNHYTDSGLLAALDVMDLVSEKGLPLSELVAPLDRYAQSGEVNFEVEDQETTMKRLAETFDDGTVDWTDGVTVSFDDWWFNVRPSNTEPLLRLNLEVQRKEDLEDRLSRVTRVIQRG